MNWSQLKSQYFNLEEKKIFCNEYNPWNVTTTSMLTVKPVFTMDIEFDRLSAPHKYSQTKELLFWSLLPCNSHLQLNFKNNYFTWALSY